MTQTAVRKRHNILALGLTVMPIIGAIMGLHTGYTLWGSKVSPQMIYPMFFGCVLALEHFP